jgi:hypothetical protein
MDLQGVEGKVGLDFDVHPALVQKDGSGHDLFEGDKLGEIRGIDRDGLG